MDIHDENGAVAVPTLYTERLSLRAPTMRDARVITKAINNINISRWLTVVPFPYGITDAEWFINENLKGRFRAHLIWQNDVLIGTVGLDDELGYWLVEDAWGKGYATEACRAVIAHHFATTDNDLIKSSYFVENNASRNVLTKLCFVDVGAHVHHSVARGEDVPGRSMELSRERWNSL